MNERAVQPTIIAPIARREPLFRPQAKTWRQKIWHTWLKVQPIFSDDFNRTAWASVTDTVLVSAHVMNQNPDLKDVPAIREYLDQLFQWEDSGAEEEGKTINDFPEIRDKFREVEEVINHAMGVEGGGRRGLDRFIRSTFLFSPEDVYTVGDPEQVLQTLHEEIKMDSKSTLGTSQWENMMQGRPTVYSLENETALNTIWLDHIEGATNRGLFKKDLFSKHGGINRAREDLVDWKRIQREEWEVSVNGLSEIARKRSFRRWKGGSVDRHRENFPEWRRVRSKAEKL